MSRSYLVTGAHGCIGAWIVRTLLGRGDRITTLDLHDEGHRLAGLLEPSELPDALAAIDARVGDVSVMDDVRAAVASARPDAIIHLAGLQVPACRADPLAGARVNVSGTLNILEAAREAGTPNVTYASSAAVYGPAPADRPVREREYVDPRTHYGVFKLANEGAAVIHWNDHSLASVGLRPLTVYGPGRDRGMTSAPTTAIKSALLGEPFTIPLTGPTDFLYVEDAALAFIACADGIREGAHVFNIAGESNTMEHCVELADRALPEDRRGLIRCEGGAIPIAPNLDDEALRRATGFEPRTSLEDGISRTLEIFERQHAQGRLDLSDLPELAAGADRG